MMFKWIARAVLAIGLALLAADLVGLIGMTGALSSLGEIWFRIDKDSLLLLQPAIERHIHPDLFDPWVQRPLEWPMAVEITVLGAILMALGWLWRLRRG